MSLVSIFALLTNLIYLNRQKPRRRLFWGCNAKVASMSLSIQSRSFSFKVLYLLVFVSVFGICADALFVLCWFAEVQTFWDWWRQEGKWHFSLLNAVICSFYVVFVLMDLDIETWIFVLTFLPRYMLSCSTSILFLKLCWSCLQLSFEF